jgi:hypothetical protein
MHHDLSGKRFFKITVIGPDGTESATGLPTWRCRCVCGRKHIVQTSATSRRNLVPVHCPCVPGRQKRQHIRHGMSGSREYSMWRALKQRCRTDAAKRQGELLPSAWMVSFLAFFGDVGPAPSLDASLIRIGSNQWEWQKGLDDRPRANARMITHGGHTASLSEWARSAGMRPSTLHARLRRGWLMDAALSRPIRIDSPVIP